MGYMRDNPRLSLPGFVQLAVNPLMGSGNYICVFLFCVFIFSLSFFHFLFIVYLVYDFIINI